MRYILTIDFKENDEHKDAIEALIENIENIAYYSDLEKEFDCELCEDTGETSEDETDESGNVARGTLSRKCSCRIPEEDPDAWRDNNEDR